MATLLSQDSQNSIATHDWILNTWRQSGSWPVKYLRISNVFSTSHCVDRIQSSHKNREDSIFRPRAVCRVKGRKEHITSANLSPQFCLSHGTYTTAICGNKTGLSPKLSYRLAVVLRYHDCKLLARVTK